MEGKSMRNKSLVLLLIAGAILSLTGCEKDPAANGKSGSIKLSFATGAPQTKTEYSGQGAKADGTATTNYDEVAWERINWIEGDLLLVWSDNAVNKKTGSNYAKYTVGGATAKDNTAAHGEKTESWSPAVALDTEDELFYDGSSTSYNFWGMYPYAAPEVLTAATAASYKPTFTIPSSQSKKSASGNVEKPNMNLAVMFAKAGSYTSTQDVQLRFYPAYTAYEFSLRLDTSYPDNTLELNKIELVSIYDEEAQNGIVGHRLSGGTVTATIAAGGATSYDISGTPLNSVAYTFNGATLSKTQDLVFTVFALPEDVTGLKVNFYVRGNTSNVPDRTAVLKKGSADITFEKCFKHRIKGIAYKDGWQFKLGGQVLDWIPNQVKTTFSENVQAKPFTIVGAIETGNHEEAYDGYARYFQLRTLKMDVQNPHFNVTFTPIAPLGGYWTLSPKSANVLDAQGGTEGFDIRLWDGEEETTAGWSSGQIMNQTVTLHIYPKADRDRSKEYRMIIQAYFSPNKSGDPSYSADSEIQDVHGDGRYSYWTFVIPATE